MERYAPTDVQSGEYPLLLVIRAQEGNALDTARTIIRVIENGPPVDSSVRKLLLTGHSFFDQGYLPCPII